MQTCVNRIDTPKRRIPPFLYKWRTLIPRGSQRTPLFTAAPFFFSRVLLFREPQKIKIESL
jgi:hypothetical protein